MKYDHLFKDWTLSRAKREGSNDKSVLMNTFSFTALGTLNVSMPFRAFFSGF